MLTRSAVVALAAAAVALVPAGAALAHPVMDEEPEAPAEPAPEAPMEHEEQPAARTGTDLVLAAPERAAPGEPARLEAVLRDTGGAPVAGAPVEFVAVAAWGEWLRGDVVLAEVATDASGRAVASVDLRGAGETPVTARFAGDERFEPASDEAVVAVSTQRQLYRPDVGITVPGLTVWWLIGLVVLVWSLFLVVAMRTFAITRAGEDAGTGRRRFLGRFLVPAGMAIVVASLGSGLVALIARSPRTHTNLGAVADHAEAGHRLPPIARLGERPAVRPLPPLLDREVSFARDVLPILHAKGGPHAHPPAHSPPPHRVLLDSYAHIMDTPGLVVPGQPSESRIVVTLLDPAVQMPPSVPPLPDDEIQVIASWIAQGASDN